MPVSPIRARLLADHGQFYAFDSSQDPYESMPEISNEAVRRGWLRSPHAIYYFCVGELWDFRLDLQQSEEPPVLGDAARLLAHGLDLPSGRLIVGNPIVGDLPSLEVVPGQYSLYMRAFNLGAETEDEIADEELMARDDLERYELTAVPGSPPRDGLVSGLETLW